MEASGSSDAASQSGYLPHSSSPHWVLDSTVASSLSIKAQGQSIITHSKVRRIFLSSRRRLILAVIGPKLIPVSMSGERSTRKSVETAYPRRLNHPFLRCPGGTGDGQIRSSVHRTHRLPLGDVAPSGFETTRESAASGTVGGGLVTGIDTVARCAIGWPTCGGTGGL